MVEAILFIGLAIIALVQLGKFVGAKLWGSVFTIIGAVVIGIMVALFDKHIGVADVTIAQGITIALDAVGLHTIARQVG